MRDLLKAAYAKAKEIITKYRELHEQLATHLIEREEMIQEEFDAYFVDMKGVPQKVAM